jgi:hypothetical protein
LARLPGHRDYLEGEWQSLRAAPLSARKARLVAALVDAYVDRLFAAAPDDGDILEFRTGMVAGSPQLGRIMALASGRGDLVLEAVAVPVAQYGSLSVEDFMVSLYNDHTVQRLMLVTTDGGRYDMMDMLEAAISAIDA